MTGRSMSTRLVGVGVEPCDNWLLTPDCVAVIVYRCIATHLTSWQRVPEGLLQTKDSSAISPLLRLSSVGQAMLC